MNSPAAPGADHPVGSNGQVGIGVLGARSMVARLAVLPAIEASSRAYLVAAASLGGPVPESWAGKTVESYEAVIDHPDVAAVYIPLPNGMHEEWVERCAAAGKHVLCEKPLAPDSVTARRMKRTADEAGILLAEAWMTPFDPRWAEALRLAETGLIGPIIEIHSTFTFTIGPEAADNYRWDPTQGGGALLDVGIYCLGPAVQLWGAHPATVDASMIPTAGGVDASTTAKLTWPGGQVATINCSFVDAEQQRLELLGPDGVLLLDGDAHTGGHRASDIELTKSDDTAPTTTPTVTTSASTTSTMTVKSADPYLAMVDEFADAVNGSGVWNRPLDESIAMLELLGRIAVSASLPGATQSAPGRLRTPQIDETTT